jgi:hypothetical protein
MHKFGYTISLLLPLKGGNTVQKKNCVFIGAILASFIFFGGISALAGDELSATEVTKLFSGKTVEGVMAKKSKSGKLKPYDAYFNSNGTIQAKHWYGKKHLTWKKRNGKWRIDDKGRICIEWEDRDKETCMVIEKEGEVYRQYKINKNGSRKHVATFEKFTDGNPDDL